MKVFHVLHVTIGPVWSAQAAFPEQFIHFSLLAMSHGLCDLSSLTRDRTWALSSENVES